MIDYDDIASGAADALREAGAPVVLVRVAEGAYDPATGAAALTETRINTIGAQFGYRASEIDGDTIRRGDRRILLVPAVAPAVGDVIEIGASRLRVLAVETVAPAGIPVLYKVQGRGL